jgi:bis(5'-nucleosidyl)-tetraphosphatase
MRKDASFGVVPMHKDADVVEFLLIQHIEGHWSFPKGHAEGNESALETAQREFEEETGILQYQVDEETSFQEEYYPQKNREIYHKIVIYYPAWVGNKQVKVQAEEVADYGWFSYKEAMMKMTFPAGKKVLREAKKYLMEKK